MTVRLVLLLALVSTSCASMQPARPAGAPPLSPEALWKWQATKVVRDLDVLRDMAISANAIQPPLLSEETTRTIVIFHRTAVNIIHESPNGWMSMIDVGLDAVLEWMPDYERELLRPYIAIVKTAIKRRGP